jgi:hypothetical protein
MHYVPVLVTACAAADRSWVELFTLTVTLHKTVVIVNCYWVCYVRPTLHARLHCKMCMPSSQDSAHQKCAAESLVRMVVSSSVQAASKQRCCAPWNDTASDGGQAA